jgi:hypothetical protein
VARPSSGFALWLPLLPVVFEIAHQLLLFGVHGDNRLAPSQAPLHLPVQMLKLSVAVGMIRPFFGLAVGLQAVAQRVQQIRHHLMTDPMLQPCQFGGQLADALARPPQRRFRIAPRSRFQQPLQIGLQRAILVHGLLPAATLAADATRSKRCGILQFGDTLADYGAGDAGRFGN